MSIDQSWWLHYCCGEQSVKLSVEQRQRDIALMQRCMSILSESESKREDVPIAALMVHERTGKIITSTNKTIEAVDPSAHAEINVLRLVSQEVGNHRLTDWEMYVTLEPCMMCFGALMEARVRRIVFAALDQKIGMLSKGCYRHSHAMGNHHFTWTQGVASAEASDNLKRFFRRRRCL